MLLLVLSCLVLLVIPATHADIFSPPNSNVGQVYEYLIDVGIDDMLVMTEQLGTSFNDVLDGIFSFFQLIGGAILALYVIVQLVRELSRGRYNMEMWLKHFVHVVIGYGLIVYLEDILGYIEKFGESFAHSISEDFSAALADFISGSGTTFAATALSTLEVIAISTLIAYMKIMRYSLLLEITMRKCFMPIAITSIVIDGTRSSGFKFFKRFFAAYMRVGVMVMCVCVSALFCMQPSIMNEGILGMIAIFLGGAALMRKLSSLTDSVVGV